MLTIPSQCYVPIRLVHRILLVSDPNTALIVAKIVDTSVNIIVYHLTRLEEGLLYIERCLGRRLHEYQTIFFGKSFSFFSADLTTAVQISLIAYKHYHYIWITVLAHLLEPTC